MIYIKIKKVFKCHLSLGQTDKVSKKQVENTVERGQFWVINKAKPLSRGDQKVKLKN